MSLKYLFDNTVFLLGAGASRSTDCLISGEMLVSLRESIKLLSQAAEVERDSGYQSYQNYRKDFEEIYDFVYASLTYQLTLKNVSHPDLKFNIEDFVLVLRQLIDKEFIIPYPLVGNWNDKILKWEIRYRDENIFELFKNFIVYELVTKWVIHDPQKAERLLAPLRELISSPENFIINIFSLNYDLVFENSLNWPSIRLLEDGFTSRQIEEERLEVWESSVFNKNGVSGESPSPGDNEKIHLYKLHGSINWSYNDSYELITKIEIQPGINAREPLIIFGSTSKMLSFDPFLFFLSEFRSKLKEARLYVVIGYSFHDKYINNLIIQQLSQDRNKMLWVVDPFANNDSGEFSERLKNIQDSRSINDIINFKKTSPAQIRILPITAEQFFLDYFSNNGNLLQTELSAIESEDVPFS